MYKNEFERNYLDNISKSTLFYGQNYYFINKYIEEYKQKIRPNNILKQYFKDYNYSLIIDYLSQSSLFGGDNLLIIFTDIKIKKKELDNLIKICYINKNSYFIYIFSGEDKNAKTLQNSFIPKYKSIWVRLFQLNINENIQELITLSKIINLSIDNESIILLLKKTNNLLIASSELSKLLILDRKIKKSDINNLIFSVEDIDLEDFFINIIELKDNIFIQLKNIIEGGETEITIIRYLSYSFNKIILLKTYQTIFNHINFKEVLGYQPPLNITNRYSNLIDKLSLSKLELISYQIIKYSILISKKLDKKSNIDIFNLLFFLKKL